MVRFESRLKKMYQQQGLQNRFLNSEEKYAQSGEAPVLAKSELQFDLSCRATNGLQSAVTPGLC